MNTGCTKTIEVAKKCDSTVLICGPTGSGKTRLARVIHDESRRRGGPFVTVNLASLHEGILESELFGHERGAFTGADVRRQGKLEIADGGTVFLDEIGELSLRLQARLLEFLQSHEISPVGSNRRIRLNVRIIAATNRDLGQAVADQEFREDLFHRLRVLSVRLPSLKDQAERFDEVLHSCLEEVCSELRRKVLRLSETAAGVLESYSWPGNYRELRNVLEYAIAASDGMRIEAEHLPDWLKEEVVTRDLELRYGRTGSLSAADRPEFNYRESMLRFEREFLSRALLRSGGGINRTARSIGMNKTTLIRRLRAFGMDRSGPHGPSGGGLGQGGIGPA